MRNVMGRRINSLLSVEVKDWWIALLAALSIWLKTNGLISNKHTLSIPACNLERAAWKYPSMCCCTVWGDVKTSRCIPWLPWLMSPTWLVNLYNDQLAIKDKTVLTFSKIRRAWLQVKQQWLPGEVAVEGKDHPIQAGVMYALFIQCVWGLHERWNPCLRSAFLSRTILVKVHNVVCCISISWVEREKMGVIFSLLVWVYVKTRLMNNIGEKKWDVLVRRGLKIIIKE